MRITAPENNESSCIFPATVDLVETETVLEGKLATFGQGYRAADLPLMFAPRTSRSEDFESQRSHNFKASTLWTHYFWGVLCGFLASLVFISVLQYAGWINFIRRSTLVMCSTPGCQYIKEMLISSLNLTVNPCDNFYEFVCGSYRQPLLSQISDLELETDSVFRALLYFGEIPSTGQTAAQKAIGMFRACMSVMRNGSEIADLRFFLGQIGLGFQKSRNITDNAVETIVHLSFEYGINTLVAFDMDEFATINNKRRLLLRVNTEIYQWYLRRNSLIKFNLITHFTVALLKTYTLAENIDDMVTPLNLTVLAAKIITVEGVAQKILAYQYAATKINNSEFSILKVRNMGDYTKGTVTPQSWSGLIARYSGSVYGAEDMIIAEVLALRYLHILLRSVKNDGVKLLLTWYLLRQFASYVDPSAASLLGSTLEKECIARVEMVMQFPLHSGYLFKVTPLKAVQLADTIASRVTDAFSNSLIVSRWLGSRNRDILLKKLHRLEVLTGYPDGLKTEADVNRYYGDYPESGASFFKSWLIASRITQMRRVKTTSSTEFLIGTVNAMYSQMANKVVVSAAILQPPLFFADGPAAYNYGSIGHIVGHEVMHAFDVRGIDIDDQGLVGDWMTPSAREEYESRTLCIRDDHVRVLYRRSSLLNDTLDSENLADFVGATTAYKALTYESVSARRREAISGLPYRPDQLFFLSYCLKWCERREANVSSSRYAPGFSRCTVPLRHMQEFSDSFNCPEGSRMNPRKKCLFW